MAERLNKDNFQAKALDTERLALVDFYSDSCIPCKKISPILAELEEEFGERLFVGKVNIAWEGELTQQYGILSAPTLLLFRNGKVIKRITGAADKATLKTAVEENI